jgi:hypothetical protein
VNRGEALLLRITLTHEMCVSLYHKESDVDSRPVATSRGKTATLAFAPVTIADFPEKTELSFRTRIADISS